MLNNSESKICGLCKKVHEKHETKCANSNKTTDDKKKH
ncbi:hypothetical protein ELUMI_v1c02590 [Williamsoniiplasma luminosum]|uniref:Uncharacterized protein n=1 Tax=Williamsoniiplasma luminosum TaxID=214888 RepID=A0A2K8NTA6_9MOLU|nr:hypothetical protein ELUMI_v1c02590 [Williamsoniiplasma luminosum]